MDEREKIVEQQSYKNLFYAVYVQQESWEK